MAAGAGAGVDLLQSDHIWTNSYKSSLANNLNVDKIGITIGISQVFDGGGSIIMPSGIHYCFWLLVLVEESSRGFPLLFFP